MAISYTWSSVAGAINGGDITIVLPASSVVAGDVVIAFGGHPNRANSNIGPTSALGTGYSVLGKNEGLAPNWGAWAKMQGTTVDASVLLKGSGSSLDATAYGVYVFRGVASVITDVGTTTAGPTASTNPAPAAITTSSQSDWIIALAGSDVLDATITSIAGYSSLIQVTADDNNDISTAGNILSSVASGIQTPGTYKDWSSGNWYAATVALRDKNAVVTTTTMPRLLSTLNAG